MHRHLDPRFRSSALLVLPMLSALLVGCSSPLETARDEGDGPSPSERTIGHAPPSTLVDVPIAGDAVRIWPYTGRSFDGAPVDPMNLVFVGEVDPVRIRSALFALDGDRTSLGLPDAPPFNARWGDAIGDVQTAYAESGGWSGSVVQITLGDYAPLRAHLRLFRTGATIEGMAVTLGAAHFELLIPGTTDHQVLSWMVARDLVVADLMRSGLLDDTLPAYPSGAIYAAPTYREIPEFIYNELPPELRVLIGGPLGDVTAPVPLDSDGNAIVLHVVGESEPATGSLSTSFRVDFDQVIPMPFCMESPFDWVYVTGPVDFDRTTRLSPSGEYTYQSSYRGRLTAVPVDITQSPPVPIGEPFEASVNGTQNGHASPESDFVAATDRRIAPQDGGTEISTVWLKVASEGVESHRELVHCLE